jgi:transposase InsO family protein
MGGRKLYHLLQDNIRAMKRPIGRDKFFDVLRDKKLLVRRKKRYAQTTQSRHRFQVFANKLEHAEITAAHQAWVSDITYLRTEQGFVYLFLVTDAGSRKIVGWHLDKSLAVAGAVKAISKALRQCPVEARPIHHSDRGFQYCSPI